LFSSPLCPESSFKKGGNEGKSREVAETFPEGAAAREAEKEPPAAELGRGCGETCGEEIENSCRIVIAGEEVGPLVEVVAVGEAAPERERVETTLSVRGGSPTIDGRESGDSEAAREGGGAALV